MTNLTNASKWHHRFFVFVLFAPSVAVLLLVVAYPLGRSVVLSLYDYNLLSPLSRPFVGLGNYRELFADATFWEAFRTTLIFNTCTVVGGFLLGFVLALLLNTELRFRALFRALAIVPWVVPYVVIGFLFLFILNQNIGIANYTLLQLGIIEEFLPWFSRPEPALTAVIVASIWNQFPFHMLTLLAGLQTVPEELQEAARIDGANCVQVFWHITLPWLRNIIVISTTLMMIQNFNNFAIIWTMTEGGPIRATTTFVIYVFRKAFVEFDFGYASAIGIVWLLVLVVFAALYMRLVEREVM